MKKIALASLSLILITGCGTVTPEIPRAKSGYADSTAPKGTPPLSSGLIKRTRDENGAVNGAILTEGKVKQYNALIADYAVQYGEETHREISPDAGIYPQPDVGQKKTFWIDLDHYLVLMKLIRWQEEGRPVDSLWMKLKNKTGL